MDPVGAKYHIGKVMLTLHNSQDFPVATGACARRHDALLRFTAVLKM
jgi:hypothetical protein